MTTNEFVQLLEENADLPLLFEYEQGVYARADFHITELKNVHFDTVDCGGVRNEWQEVHLQLWESKLPQPTHRVDTSKALKIIEVVNRVRESWGDVELKVEYGNRHFHTAILPIKQVEVLEDQLIVRLGQDHTTCKAIDRATSVVGKALACCGPTAEPASTMKELAVADSVDCCTPGGGCC
jgi:hypothetical protein